MENENLFEFGGVKGRKDKHGEMTGEGHEFDEFYSIFHPARMFFYGNEKVIFQMYELSDCPAWADIIVPGYVRSKEFEDYEEYLDFGKTLGDEKSDIRDITSILVEPVRKADQESIKKQLMDLVKNELESGRRYTVKFWERNDERKKEVEKKDYLEEAKKNLVKFKQLWKGRKS